MQRTGPLRKNYPPSSAYLQSELSTSFSNCGRSKTFAVFPHSPYPVNRPFHPFLSETRLRCAPLQHRWCPFAGKYDLYSHCPPRNRTNKHLHKMHRYRLQKHEWRATLSSSVYVRYHRQTRHFPVRIKGSCLLYLVRMVDATQIQRTFQMVSLYISSIFCVAINTWTYNNIAKNNIE